MTVLLGSPSAVVAARNGLLGGRAPLTYAPDWQFSGGSVASMSYTTTADSGTFRERFTAKVRISNPRLVFTGFDAVNGDLQDPYTIAASAVEIGGATIPVTFNGGSRNATVQPGSVLRSDPIGVTIAAAATFFARTHITTTLGLRLPLGKLVVSANGEAHNLGTGAANLAYGTGTTSLATTSGNLFGPAAVLGDVDYSTTQQVVVLATGDSNTDRGDGGSTLNYVGETCQQLGLPIINIGRFGEQVQDVVGTAASQQYSTTRARRNALIADATHAICMYGTNDRRSGARTAPQIQTDLLAYWNYLARQGVKVLAVTTPPETSSTDAWASTPNQTVTATEAVRTTVNDYIRTKPLPVYAVLDLADIVETARNSGKWKSGPVLTGDGLHINNAAAVVVANALVAAGIGATLAATDPAPAPTA